MFGFKERFLKSLRAKSGFGLILVVALAAILAIFTAAVGLRLSTSQQAVSRAGQAEQARYGAEAAIQLALGYFCEPPKFADLDGDGTLGDSWLLCDRSVHVTFSNGVEAGARLYHNIAGLPGGVGSGVGTSPPDGYVIPKGNFYILAVGQSPSGVKSEASTVGNLYSSDFPLMDNAILAREKLTVKGRVDYFDATEVPPSPRAWTTYPNAGLALNDPSSCNPLANVAIDSKNDPVSTTDIDDFSKINGGLLFRYGDITLAQLNAFVATKSSPSFVIMEPTAFNPATAQPKDPGGSLSAYEPLAGYVTWQTYSRDYLDFGVPGLSPIVQALGASVGSDYVVPGSGVELDEGKTYICRNFESNAASGVLKIKDTNADSKFEAVRIIATGSSIIFDHSSGVNADQLPSKLKILAVSTNCKLTLKDSEINALLAGNDLDIKIENSTVWGALFGKSVELDNVSLLHYPYQLSDREQMVGLAGASLVASTGGGATSTLSLDDVVVNLTPGQGKAFQQYNPPAPPVIPGATFIPPPGGGQPPALPPDPPPPTGGGGGGGGGSMAMQMK